MNIKIGDYVRSYGAREYVKIYKVTKIGKARAKAVEVGNFPGLVFEGTREIAFMLKTGKVVYTHSDQVSAAPEGLEYWQKKNQEKKDEIDAKNAARDKQWQTKLDRAKELNPVFNFVEMEMGLKKLVVQLSKNVFNLLFIAVRPYEGYGDHKVLVDIAAFGHSWHSPRAEFYHNNDVRGESLEAVLYDYIASNLIERTKS